jgi:hypothetical protein
MNEALQILQNWGPWGLLAAVIIFVVTNPEKAETVAGWFLGLFSWTGRGIRRASIKSKLQGQVSSFALSVDKEVKGVMPYNMRLNFIKEIDRAQLDPTKKTVIVCIKDRGSEDQNLVHAMMAFCPVGVVPQARPYLGIAMNEGINITVTRKLLNRLKHYSALKYMYEKVLPECAKGTPGLDTFCRVFDLLDENGLFTQVVLSEIRDFGARVETRYPQQSHADEAAEFVTYIYQVATKPEGDEMPEIGHLGRYITTAFVFIGTGEVMWKRGATPYLDHIRKLRSTGFEKAYLAARGAAKGTDKSSLSIKMAERVSYLAERAKLAKRGRDMSYYATTADGVNRLQVLIELVLLPSTS